MGNAFGHGPKVRRDHRRSAGKGFQDRERTDLIPDGGDDDDTRFFHESKDLIVRLTSEPSNSIWPFRVCKGAVAGDLKGNIRETLPSIHQGLDTFLTRQPAHEQSELVSSVADSRVGAYETRLRDDSVLGESGLNKLL